MKKVLLAVFFLALSACENGNGQSETTAPNLISTTVGDVLETMDVGSYTYIKLDSKGRELWLATSPTAVRPGDTLKYTGGMTMTNFYSSMLDRTFSEIQFVANVEVIGSSAPLTSGFSGDSPMDPDPHAGLDVSPTGPAGMAEPDASAERMTIVEILARPEDLEGKQVILSGRVIKFNANIMGKNWITLQDGTGVAPDNILTATSVQTAAVGDELTLRATLRSDVDLGQGYQYRVLLEDAAF